MSIFKSKICCNEEIQKQVATKMTVQNGTTKKPETPLECTEHNNKINQKSKMSYIAMDYLDMQTSKTVTQ